MNREIDWDAVLASLMEFRPVSMPAVEVIAALRHALAAGLAKRAGEQ